MLRSQTGAGGQVASLYLLGGGDNSGDHRSTHGACQLLKGAEDRIAVGVELVGQAAQTVGHDITYRKALGHGKKGINYGQAGGGSSADIKRKEQRGTQCQDGADQDRHGCAAVVQQFAGKRIEHGAQHAARQKDAACPCGILVSSRFGAYQKTL